MAPRRGGARDRTTEAAVFPGGPGRLGKQTCNARSPASAPEARKWSNSRPGSPPGAPGNQDRSSLKLPRFQCPHRPPVKTEWRGGRQKNIRAADQRRETRITTFSSIGVYLRSSAANNVLPRPAWLPGTAVFTRQKSCGAIPSWMTPQPRCAVPLNRRRPTGRRAAGEPR